MSKQLKRELEHERAIKAAELLGAYDGAKKAAYERYWAEYYQAHRPSNTGTDYGWKPKLWC